MENTQEKAPDVTTVPTPESEAIDDWNKPLSSEELEAIDAAFAAEEAATSNTTDTLSISSFSCSIKTQQNSSSVDDDTRPKTRRRLPDSFGIPGGVSGSNQDSSSSGLVPCRTNSAFRHANVKLKYPPMNFGGRIVYCRSVVEVEEATLQILKLLEAKKCELGRAILGLDIEWKPSFDQALKKCYCHDIRHPFDHGPIQGIPQGIAAVMQICGDMTHCYVLHIFHSGIPQSLQSLLEDSSSIKVGVGIDNDAVKVFHNYNVSIKSVQDLSVLANQTLGGVPKQWSLSALVETLTCKQLLKPKNIRLGNWEADILSKPQLQYAATDAFVSWYLYEVLKSFPTLSESQTEN